MKIEGGHLDLIKHPDGDINLLFAKKDHSEKPSTEDTSAFHLDLQKVEPHDFHVSYLDEASGSHHEFELNNTNLAFRFAPDHIYAFLDAEFIFTIMKGDDSCFFRNKHFELHTSIDYHPEEEALFISPSKIKMEKALFGFEGSLDIRDSMLLDLRIKGEKPDFNMFIAFAPEDVAKTLERYKNEGNIYFNARINGRLAAENMPYIEAEFGCSKAYFLNPDINKKVDQMGFRGYFTNGHQRTPETMQLNLFDIYAQPDKGIFKGNIVVKNFKDPHITMNIHSDFDLKFVGEFLGIDIMSDLEGQVILDMNFNELMDMEIPENNLVKLKQGIDSDLIIKNLNFRIPGHPYPKGEVEIDKLSFRMGNSDIHLDGWLNDLPAIFHHEHKPVKFKLKAHSKK
jgi:hypothetical protein